MMTLDLKPILRTGLSKKRGTKKYRADCELLKESYKELLLIWRDALELPMLRWMGLNGPQSSSCAAAQLLR